MSVNIDEALVQLYILLQYMKDFVQYQSDDGFNIVLVVWENGRTLS